MSALFDNIKALLTDKMFWLLLCLMLTIHQLFGALVQPYLDPFTWQANIPQSASTLKQLPEAGVLVVAYALWFIWAYWTRNGFALILFCVTGLLGWLYFMVPSLFFDTQLLSQHLVPILLRYLAGLETALLVTVPLWVLHHRHKPVLTQFKGAVAVAFLLLVAYGAKMAGFINQAQAVNPEMVVPWSMFYVPGFFILVAGVFYGCVAILFLEEFGSQLSSEKNTVD